MTKQGQGGLVRIVPVDRADAWDVTVTRDGNFWKVTAIELAPVEAFTEHLVAARAVLGDLAKHYRSNPQKPEFQAGLAEIARKRTALDCIEAQFQTGTTPVSQLHHEVTAVMQDGTLP